jgi:hypothetical protein
MENTFAKLFGTITMHTPEQLEVMLLSLDKPNAQYLLLEAVSHAYRAGVYSLIEAEVISKTIRILTQQDHAGQDKDSSDIS